MTKISDIEGIGKVYAARLEKAGIKTTLKLLKDGATPAGRKKIAEATDIDASQVLKWVNMADLFRIKGVSTQYSELLEAAGVDTVKELRNRRADNLTAKMKEVNASKKLVRQVPSEKMVEKWVAYAKELAPVVSY